MMGLELEPRRGDLITRDAPALEKLPQRIGRVAVAGKTTCDAHDGNGFLRIWPRLGFARGPHAEEVNGMASRDLSVWVRGVPRGE